MPYSKSILSVVLAGLLSACGNSGASDSSAANSGKGVEIRPLSSESKITAGGVIRHCKIEVRAKNETKDLVARAGYSYEINYPEDDFRTRFNFVMQRTLEDNCKSRLGLLLVKTRLRRTAIHGARPNRAEPFAQ